MRDGMQVGRTRFIGTILEPKKFCDPVNNVKGVNGWHLSKDVDHFGKITMVASKDIGRLGSSRNQGTEAKIEIRLETTEKRSPSIKAIENDSYSQTIDYVE